MLKSETSRRALTVFLLVAVGSIVASGQALRYPVLSSGGRADADGTVLVFGQPLVTSLSQSSGLTLGVVPAWLSTPDTAVQWNCATGNWSSTACWTGLNGSDAYPDNGAVNYAVTLPSGSYTVTVDPAAVDIDSLSMPGTATTVNVNAGNALAVQDALAAHGVLRVSGTFTAPASAAFDVTQLEVRALSGGRVTLPITSYAGVTGRVEVLQSFGAGSVLDLNSLASINGNGNGMILQASNGGTTLVPVLTSIANASLSSTGSAALLRLDGLETLPPGINLTVDDGGTVLAAPLTRLDRATVIVREAASMIDLSHLTNIDASTLQLAAGAQASLPLVTTYLGTTGPESLLANGAGSLLEMNALTNLDGAANGMIVEAANGGVVRMPAVASVANVTLSANGGGQSGTQLQLNSLSSVGPGCRIDVTNGGTLIGAPFTALNNLALLNMNYSISVFDTSHVTTIDQSSVLVRNGAVLQFPLVLSYDGGPSGIRSLEVHDAGSRLELNSAASFSAPSNGLALKARFGGVFQALNAQSLFNGVQLHCDGTGSLLELGGVDLTSVNGMVRIGGGLPGGTSPGGDLRIRTSFSFAMTDPTRFAWGTGSSLTMLGGTSGECATLEAAGEERGTVPAGWTSNFNFGRLVIGPGAHVRLVDMLDNHNPPLGGPEALYVESIEFADASGRLDRNGLSFYYHTVVGDQRQIINGQCGCPGDTDASGAVDLADLARVLSTYGLCVGQPGFNPAADFDGDGCVDLGDLAFLLARYGSTCP